MAEEIKQLVKERIKELEELIKDAEESIKIAKRLGVAVTEEEMELQTLKRDLKRWREVVEGK